MDTQIYSFINNPKGREKVLEMMNNFKLVDFYSVPNPDKKVLTWKKKKIPLKLDYILMSENCTNECS